MKRILIGLILALAAAWASAETVLVDVRLSLPLDTSAAQKHLQLVEGAAMGPFFDAGHIVFDSNEGKTVARDLGASMVLQVILELDAREEGQLVDPEGVAYELLLVDDNRVVASGRIMASALGDTADPDERSVLLGVRAAGDALAQWSDAGSRY
jgi:hypothetical protein